MKEQSQGSIISLDGFPGPREVPVELEGRSMISHLSNNVQFEKAILRSIDGSSSKEVAALFMYSNNVDNPIHHYFTKQDLMIFASMMIEIAESIEETAIAH